MKNNKRNSLLFWTLILCSSWLIVLFVLNPHYIYTWDILEEWFATHGLIYYKDFSSFHFPLSKLIFIPIRLATGWNLEIDPFFGLSLGMGTLFSLYIFGKKYLSAKATSLSLIFFTLFFWYSATGIMYFDEILTGFLLSLIVFYLFRLKEIKNIRPIYFFVLGLLFAFTELAGQIVSITLFFSFIFVCDIIIKYKSNYKESVKLFFYFILGILLPFLTLSFYFFKVHAFPEFFFYNTLYYFRYAGYEKNLVSLPIGQLLAFYTPLFISIVILILVLIKKSKITKNYLIMLCLVLSTIPLILSSVYHPHHLNYALPVLAIIAGISFDIAVKLRHPAKIIYFLGACFFLFFSITTIIPWYLSKIIYPPSLKIANDLYPNTRNSLSQTIDWLRTNSPANSKIMVVGTPLVYIKSNRLPASRPSVGLPHTWQPLNEISHEILTKQPSYWVIDKQFTKRLIYDYKQPELVEFLDKMLNHYYHKQIEFETWQVWEKNLQIK